MELELSTTIISLSVVFCVLLLLIVWWKIRREPRLTAEFLLSRSSVVPLELFRDQPTLPRPPHLTNWQPRPPRHVHLTNSRARTHLLRQFPVAGDIRHHQRRRSFDTGSMVSELSCKSSHTGDPEPVSPENSINTDVGGNWDLEVSGGLMQTQTNINDRFTPRGSSWTARNSDLALYSRYSPRSTQRVSTSAPSQACEGLEAPEEG